MVEWIHAYRVVLKASTPNPHYKFVRSVCIPVCPAHPTLNVSNVATATTITTATATQHVQEDISPSMAVFVHNAKIHVKFVSRRINAFNVKMDIF